MWKLPSLKKNKPPWHTSHDLNMVFEKIVSDSGRVFGPGVVKSDAGTITPSNSLRRYAESGWSYDKVDWFQFEGCHVNSTSGVVFHRPTGSFFVDFHWGWGKPRSALRPKFDPLRIDKVRSQDPFLMVTGNGYHGVIEDIPNALKLKAEFKDLKLATSRPNGWVHQLLISLGVPEDDFIFLTQNRWIDSCNFVAATKSSFGEFVNAEGIKYLSKKSIATESMKASKNRFDSMGTEKKSNQKIYVSREKSSSRWFSAEREVKALFEDYGFRSIYLEELAVKDQIKMFSDASFVAGFHGAGLVNLVFSEPNIKVLELYHSNKINPCYLALCTVRGHQYSNFEVAENFANKSSLNTLLDKLLK